MKKNSWNIMFDHLRFDFGVKGIIIYDANAVYHRVHIVGHPYVREIAVNDNEAKR